MDAHQLRAWVIQHISDFVHKLEALPLLLPATPAPSAPSAQPDDARQDDEEDEEEDAGAGAAGGAAEGDDEELARPRAMMRSWRGRGR